jgi:hypothetical protein
MHLSQHAKNWNRNLDTTNIKITSTQMATKITTVCNASKITELKFWGDSRASTIMLSPGNQ